MKRAGWLDTSAARDCFFLAAAVVFSLVWYAPKLGF
jgi:hypothetical protein